MGDPQTFAQDAGREILWAQPGETCVEWQFVQPLYAQLFKLVGTGRAVHESKGRRVWRKEVPWVWLKRQYAQRCSRDGRARQINHRTMPQVHPVKIADRHGCTAIAWLYELIIADNFHGPCLASPGSEGKNTARFMVQNIAR